MDILVSKDKKLLYILLAASKKPEGWINIVQEIYTMDKLSFLPKMQRDTFYRIWSEWTEYLEPVRSDFS